MSIVSTKLPGAGCAGLQSVEGDPRGTSQQADCKNEQQSDIDRAVRCRPPPPSLVLPRIISPSFLCFRQGLPAVFQCGGCRSVLSDSSEYVCTARDAEGAKFVCLRAVTDAHVDRIATTTASPRSVYFAVCCQACGAAVGQLYTEAPPGMAPALNLFCLDVSRCSSYQLGSADVRAQGASSAAGPAAGAAAAAGQGAQQQQQQQDWGQAGQQQQQSRRDGGAGGADAGLLLDLLQRVERLEATLCTLQGIQLLHDEQLQQLPGYQGDAAAAAGAMG